eukprot:TRINITY_DN8167_c2_g1_i1.p2 TRINITY_DN8167_c2_g1~~TRINITY_DN8167_c2_g1_i1.p2  ORF type:complete len:203 (+),score=8.88 TRINITY_DN8167_c2_g1_i1:417-1025(+)
MDASDLFDFQDDTLAQFVEDYEQTSDLGQGYYSKFLEDTEETEDLGQRFLSDSSSSDLDIWGILEDIHRENSLDLFNKQEIQGYVSQAIRILEEAIAANTEILHSGLLTRVPLVFEVLQLACLGPHSMCDENFILAEYDPLKNLADMYLSYVDRRKLRVTKRNKLRFTHNLYQLESLFTNVYECRQAKFAFMELPFWDADLF